MNENIEQQAKLALPGAGISTFEMLVLNHVIKPIAIPNGRSQDGLAALTKGADVLKRMLKSIDTALLTERVLVPRPWFVEDSSRNWSAALLFRHLAIVNFSISKAISRKMVSLESEMPSGAERVSAVKPEPAKNDVKAIEEYEASVAAIISAVSAFPETELSQRVIPHPWLGELTHIQWLWFAGFHQRAHVRHLKGIIAGLKKMRSE